MVKHTFILLCILSTTLYGQRGNDVQILIDAPENVVAGNDFQVTVTFQKGKLTDYSRFSQDLPAGFTATNVSSPNADFTFDRNENRIRIIWLRMPDEETLRVQYAIAVDERIQGSLNLRGSFAYVDEGERVFLTLDEGTTVNVLPNPDLDPSEIVAIEDFGKQPVTSPGTGAETTPSGTTGTATAGTQTQTREETQSESQTRTQAAPTDTYAMVVRQKPVVHPNGMIYVTLLVSNPEGTRFMKLEESIPSGYTFEDIDRHGATVSLTPALAKFVWMQPPPERVFTVEYRLVPILEQEQQEDLSIAGNFSYSQGTQMNSVEVREKEANITAMNAAQKAELLRTGTVPTGLREVEPSTAQSGQPVEPTPREVKSTGKTSASTKTIRPSAVTPPRRGVISIPDLAPQQGVYFRVQVAAVKNPYFVNTYFAAYPIFHEVRQERTTGWYKYTVGQFASYNEAAGFKNRIKRETPVNGAFVVAYRDGKRISLDEAVK